MSNNWWGKSLVSNKYVSIIRRDGVIHQIHETGTVSDGTKEPAWVAKDDPQVPREACLTCGKPECRGSVNCFRKLKWGEYLEFRGMVEHRMRMGYGKDQIAEEIGVKRHVIQHVVNRIYPGIGEQEIIKAILEGEKHERV